MAGKAPATYPDLILALGKLGLSDRAIEREAKIPQAFIAKLRRGECGSAKAQASVAKLLRLLEKKGVEATPAAKAPLTAPAEPEIPEDLADLVDGADTHEAIGRALKKTASLVVAGKLDRFTGAAIESLLKSRAQVLDRELEELARVDSGKPVRVVVEFRNDWRGAPACELCHGSGRANAGRTGGAVA